MRIGLISLAHVGSGGFKDLGRVAKWSDQGNREIMTKVWQERTGHALQCDAIVIEWVVVKVAICAGRHEAAREHL